MSIDLDKCYPETEVYYTTWLGGTSGAFVSMCLYNLTTADLEIKLSEFGHAHVNQQEIKKKNHITLKFGPIYKTTIPKISTRPLILFGHENDIDFEYLFNKYPKCKLIIIHVEDKMIPRLIGNMLFKNWTNPNDSHWASIRSTHKFMSGYENPVDVPSDLIKEFIELYRKNYKKDPFFFDKTFLPDTYKGSIFYIDFYDIIHNMSKVLNQLSEITNRPVTPFLEQQALNYQNKQIELVNSKMPWLDDK